MWRLVFDALVGVVFLGMFVYCLFHYGERERVVCDRVTGRARCTVMVDGVMSSSTTVYDDLVRVRAIDHENMRGGHWYGVALEDRAGNEHQVARSVLEEEALRVETWFVERERRVEVERAAFAGNVMIVIVMLGMGSFFMGWVAISRWRDRKR